MEVRQPRGERNLPTLDAGERSAIALALEHETDILLVDDRRAVRAAQFLGLRVTGTLGMLDLAAERGLVDFGGAVQRLESTTFHRPIALLNVLLEKHRRPEG